tara:strand:+ start:1109 stop:1294 length:186 start_codon:yes stop_codon:yes gene_type:complete
MKTKEIAETESLVGKLCKFGKITVLIVKEENNPYKHFGKRYYALFPGQGIDILPESRLKTL